MSMMGLIMHTVTEAPSTWSSIWKDIHFSLHLKKTCQMQSKENPGKIGQLQF